MEKGSGFRAGVQKVGGRGGKEEKEAGNGNYRIGRITVRRPLFFLRRYFFLRRKINCVL